MKCKGDNFSHWGRSCCESYLKVRICRQAFTDRSSACFKNTLLENYFVRNLETLPSLMHCQSSANFNTSISGPWARDLEWCPLCFRGWSIGRKFRPDADACMRTWGAIAGSNNISSTRHGGSMRRSDHPYTTVFESQFSMPTLSASSCEACIALSLSPSFHEETSSIERYDKGGNILVSVYDMSS